MRCAGRVGTHSGLPDSDITLAPKHLPLGNYGPSLRSGCQPPLTGEKRPQKIKKTAFKNARAFMAPCSSLKTYLPIAILGLRTMDCGLATAPASPPPRLDSRQ